jgi:hypothetical protein
MRRQAKRRALLNNKLTIASDVSKHIALPSRLQTSKPETTQPKLEKRILEKIAWRRWIESNWPNDFDVRCHLISDQIPQQLSDQAILQPAATTLHYSPLSVIDQSSAPPSTSHPPKHKTTEHTITYPDYYSFNLKTNHKTPSRLPSPTCDPLLFKISRDLPKFKIKKPHPDPQPQNFLCT